MNTVPTNDEQLRAEVRARYAKTALHVLGTEQASANACCETTCCTPEAATDSASPAATTEPTQQDACCATTCCTTSPVEEGSITRNLYSQAELGTLPLAAALASLGCGNPTALAELKAGERVLDLGSGGGIDVLLSARRVGPTGFAYGLDMTDAMLALAERNRLQAGIENVAFLKGIIEAIPLPANSVDVVISNCVINLSADKGQVLREAYRVLAPGGRFAVSDIVFQGQIPQALRTDLESWAGCIAGALEEDTYRQLLTTAGFTEIEIEVTRRYALQDIADSGAQASIAALSENERAEVDGRFVSAFIRARKPVQS
ncbi:MAG: arsenite methyltransferase [Chloroflexota bacterium]|nr:arsenite methyltransferase [Chloroflexota bacterium]